MSFALSQRLVHPLLPYGIMGANALLAGLLCQTLPETKGIPTPETMDIESEEEACIALQTTNHEDKNAEENGNITMADTVKDTTSTKATLVTDKDPSAI